MPIDFHAAGNRYTYAGRSADESWRTAMLSLADVAGTQVVDVGCGAGVYSRAWVELGARHVIGVDFSGEMLTAARAETDPRAAISWVCADAAATGLSPRCADIVFARALVHHVADVPAVLAEARRLLRAGGILIVQDRTAPDVRQPGSDEHLRGYILERFPKLLEIELARRPRNEGLLAWMRDVGLSGVTTHQLWETRRIHAECDAFLQEIRRRQGRSILHELTDEEIDQLVDYLMQRMPSRRPLVERDRWTIWTGRAIQDVGD